MVRHDRLGLGYDVGGSYAGALIGCTGGMIATSVLLVLLPRFPEWGSATETEDAEVYGLPAAVATGGGL